MIEDYLNQSAIWKKANGYNEYGEQSFIESTIKVRFEGRRQLVRNKQGEEVVSEARAFLKEAVSPNDIINYNGRDWAVITVREGVSLDGEVIFVEALL